jgi:MscS family membrane protein
MEVLEGNLFFTENFTYAQVASAFLVIFVAFLLSRIAKYFISKKLQKTSGIADTDTEHQSFLMALNSPVMVLIYLIALRIAIYILNPPYILDVYLNILHILITAVICWFIFRFLDVVTQYLVNKYKDSEEKVVTSMFPIITKVVKVFIIIIAFIMVIQNLGYSVSSLLAGLGIGGLAVALAAQDTLANVFGSVMIFIDKPFIIGDWIVVKDVEGVVEDVGFRTTKIRTWERSEVSIPNSVVSKEIIQNFTRRPQRRVSTVLTVTYDTTPEQMEQAIQALREIILNYWNTDKENFRVYFSEFGNSHLGIFMQFFFKTADFVEFLEGRQDIYLQIMRKFKEIGVKFAFPSTTVYFGDSKPREMMEKINQVQFSEVQKGIS